MTRYINRVRKVLESKIDALMDARKATIHEPTIRQIEKDLDTYHLLYRTHCGEEYRLGGSR